MPKTTDTSNHPGSSARSGSAPPPGPRRQQLDAFASVVGVRRGSGREADQARKPTELDLLRELTVLLAAREKDPGYVTAARALCRRAAEHGIEIVPIRALNATDDSDTHADLTLLLDARCGVLGLIDRTYGREPRLLRPDHPSSMEGPR